jgi:hypothetical protein
MGQAKWAENVAWEMLDDETKKQDRIPEELFL